jgi:transcriptional regulator with XRE-family HTH domain
MAQPAPTSFRLTKRQTADLIFGLEERKYGRRLTSQGLAQKADVDLDFVNRVERHLPIENPHALERIANALGITAELLCKIAGLTEITESEWTLLNECLPTSPAGQPVPLQCERIGFRRIWK